MEATSPAGATAGDRRLIRRLTRSPHIHDEVAERFREHLAGGRILDLPAGSGVNARRLAAGGYEVVAADLHPERCRGEGLRVERADLAAPLPFADGSFDGVLHSEGIEHLDAQIAALAELARVLRPGGVLVVTTPNVLHLAARVGTLLAGHPQPHRSIVVRTAAYWGERDADGGRYFGHAFLIDYFQLRFYLEHVGLEVRGVDTTRYSLNALLLAPLLLPGVWLATRRMLRGRRSRIPAPLRRELARHVLSPALLFGKKLIVVARKPGGAGPGAAGERRASREG